MSKQPTLRRTVGTTLLALYGIGNIVGAGVYVLVGKIAGPAGYLAVLAFLVAAVVAFCAALSYSELAARYPVSAGISVYLYEAFKRRWLSTVVGIMLILAGTVSTATLLKGFSGYFTSIVPVDPTISVAVAVIILLVIMLRGIKESVGTAVILTLIEVGGLLFLISSIMFAQPHAIGNFSQHFVLALGSFDIAAFSGVMAAAFIAFYAFIGFDDMVNIAEEVKKPQTAYPKAILAAMIAVTILYVAVVVVALGVVSPDILSHSSAPLADAYQSATGQMAGMIVVVSLIATLNGIIVNVVMGSRFLYGLSNRGWITPWFKKISRRHVPARGIVGVGVAAFLFTLWLPLERLAQTTSFLLLFVFFAVNVSLIVIRRQHKETPMPRLAPRFVPWLGAAACVGLLVAQMTTFF